MSATTPAETAQHAPAVIPGTAQSSNEIAQVIHMIERVMQDDSVAPEKVEKFLDLQERILDRRARMLFSESMAQAQSEMGPVSADCYNEHTRSRYASYKALDGALRPIYSRHGFALSFGTADSPLENHIRIVCDISHAAGMTKHVFIDMPADGKGAKGNDVMTKTHATGSASSYGMRYLLKMIFNVAIGEEDDDGNAAGRVQSQKKLEKVSPQQLKALEKLAADAEANIPALLNLYMIKSESLEDVPAQLFGDVKKALERKIAVMKRKKEESKS